MQNRVRLAIIMLALGAIACGVLNIGQPDQSTEQQPVLPTPTPPPIPTSAPTTPVPTDAAVAEEIPNTAKPGQTTHFGYGSVRNGDMGLYGLTADGSFTGRLPVQSDLITHATWVTVAPDGSRIAFVSVRGSADRRSNGIFVMSADGSNLTQLTFGDGSYPNWSPDGQILAYACNDNTDICLVSANDGSSINLTEESTARESYPAWTPDNRIVFMSDRDVVTETGLFSEIYIMNSDGSDVVRLTEENVVYNAHPRVSPDGALIAYESDRDVTVGSEIYIMNLDGSNNRRITVDDLWNQNPAWSPDSSQLLFATDLGDGNLDLYTVSVIEASSPVRLTEYAGEDGGLRLGHEWLTTPILVPELVTESIPGFVPPEQPRGGQAVTNAIVFAANDTNCPDCLETGIYTVNFDGANLTALPIEGLYPAWSTDFRRINYIQDGELFVANADGAQATQVTFAFYGLSAPIWKSDESKIIADCTPYGQHDICLIDPQSGRITNVTEELTFGSGVPYPAFYLENYLVGNQVLDAAGTPFKSYSFSAPGARVSPDGRQMAAIIDRQLNVINLDTNEVTPLTTDNATKGFPMWSSDGSLIVYSIAPGDGFIYLSVIRADGSNATTITPPIMAGASGEPPGAITTFLGYSWGP